MGSGITIIEPIGCQVLGYGLDLALALGLA
jgi:hypothetical protein